MDQKRADILLRELAARLVTKGAIRNPEWRPAFERVFRHMFVPHIYRRAGSQWTLLDGNDPALQEEWLAAVYTDEALVTQVDPDRPDVATSSSTEPTLMAVMLEALDVKNGHSVLEIGTGTGYNAALLCERLGSKRVTTIDIDPTLVEEARQRLSACGYTPTVTVADGVDGYAPRAPYDRILATCSVTHIPQAWLRQTRSGGQIVVNIFGRVKGAIARITVMPDGTGQGKFLPEAAAFVGMRRDVFLSPTVQELMRRVVADLGTSRPACIPDEFDQDSFRFFIHLHLPNAVHFSLGAPSSVSPDYVSWLVDPGDWSWARTTVADEAGRRTVTQGGPRRLWDTVEEAHTSWLKLGKPTRERFGITITPEDHQYVWVDAPHSSHAWALPR